MSLKTVVLLICIAAVCIFAGVYSYGAASQCASLALEPLYLLIDAGHGGADNGASAADGTMEDGINLSISLQLRDLLTFCGYPIQMTRTEDTVVISDQDDPARGWKVNDMYARLRLYDSAALTVSIHQNHFSQSKYNGTQVFYGTKSVDSSELATAIQSKVVSMLQPQNKRQIKPAGENIFLLHRTQKSAVIVECGFLSNAEETARLKDKLYQQQMAFAIGCGILEYTS